MFRKKSNGFKQIVGSESSNAKCVSLFTMQCWAWALTAPIYKMELVPEPQGFLMN